MEVFLNEIDKSIVILDEDFNFKFCNDKFLKETDIKSNDIDNLFLNTSIKEELNRNFKNNNKYVGIIKSYIFDKYIILDSTIIKSIKDNKIIYYVVVDKVRTTNTTVYKGRLNDNIVKVINSEQYYIELLENIKSNLNPNKENIVNNISNEDLLDGLISELYKIELVQTSFSLFLSLSTDFAGSMDKDGSLIMLEGTWTNTIGWSYEELINMNILDIIHSDYIDEFKSILNNPCEKIISIENQIRCKDGTYKWFRWNMKYLKGMDIIVLTAKNITIEKEEQQSIIELKKEIEAENLKNQFFANLSHEFKTPLNIILSVIQLLDMNIANEKIYAKEDVRLLNHINLIKQNAYRLLRLANNLIDMSKIDAGYYNLKFCKNNIVSIVEDISLSVAQYASDKGLSLVFDTDCEEVNIACDPDKIERILLNLLSNSIKNTEDGGKIFVNLTTDEDNVSISVGDNGKGIPKDKLSKIFDRFEQVDKCLNRSYEGSGIGLSLVHSLVEMHNGRIDVRSKLDVGSEFKFTIPKNLVSDYDDIEHDFIISENRIERCNIEFSDIYK